MAGVGSGRGRVNWRKEVKTYRLTVTRHVSTRDVIYNMMPITLYEGKLFREQSPTHQKELTKSKSLKKKYITKCTPFHECLKHTSKHNNTKLGNVFKVKSHSLIALVLTDRAYT